MGQNQPGGFQDDGVPSAAPPPELTTITGVGVPGDGTTRLDEAEASPAQEALDQARVQQLTPDSHDELVSNAADNDERRAARDGSCLLYTSPSPRDRTRSRMPSSA